MPRLTHRVSSPRDCAESLRRQLVSDLNAGEFSLNSLLGLLHFQSCPDAPFQRHHLCLSKKRTLFRNRYNDPSGVRNRGILANRSLRHFSNCLIIWHTSSSSRGCLIGAYGCFVHSMTRFRPCSAMANSGGAELVPQGMRLHSVPTHPARPVLPVNQALPRRRFAPQQCLWSPGITRPPQGTAEQDCSLFRLRVACVVPTVPRCRSRTPNSPFH